MGYDDEFVKSNADANAPFNIFEKIISTRVKNVFQHAQEPRARASWTKKIRNLLVL